MVLSRRTLVTATALLPVTGVAGSALVDAPRAAAAPTQPPVRPRADWAGDLKPRGALEEEADVRFLLVHHTLTPNTDTPERIPERLRQVFRFHTSRERGWADVAYNFFVDPSGTIWEGREGSLTRPMKGDATGGSQGFALLCCFVGDFTEQPPTPEAMAAMTSLLAWLAARQGLDLAAPVTFTSRGSTKWRKGVEVTTEQVAAHRDMSSTECPGDALYPLVRERLLPQARALLAPEPSPTPSPEPTADPTPTASPTPQAGSPQVGEEVLRGAGGAAVALGVAGVLATVVAGRRGRGSGAEQPEDDGGAPEGQGGEQADEETDRGA